MNVILGSFEGRRIMQIGRWMLNKDFGSRGNGISISMLNRCDGRQSMGVKNLGSRTSLEFIGLSKSLGLDYFVSNNYCT